MKKEKALFLGFLIVLVGLFGLCGFSLIKCFVYGTAEEGESNVLEIIYLFLHLIMIAIVFYLTFRAFRIKSSIIRLMMLDDNEKKTAKTLIISGILSGLFYTIGIYATLHIFGLKMPPLDYFSMSLSHDLMNAGFFFGSIGLVFFLYPFLYEKDEKSKNIEKI